MPQPRPRDRLEPLRRLARLVPGGMAAGRWLHALLDPELRSVARLRRRDPGTLLQPWPVTWDERYPALFDALAERLAHLPAPRILSFGCASGAEVRALRRRLPHAKITGIDPNPRAIRQARKADPTNASDYYVADRPPPVAEYDSVLALAVFRHGELAAQRPDLAIAILPFARFGEAMSRIDAALARDGWIALANAQFAFGQLPWAANYEPVASLDEVPDALYGIDERRIENPRPQPQLWRKRG